MNLQNIIDEILSESIKVVSFDIFDTLLARPIIKPTDLFKLVGLRTGYFEDFIEMRVAAEKCAGKKRDSSRDAVTFDEIYREFGNLFDVPDDVLVALQREELAIEMQYLRPRKSAKKLFDTAKAAGKRIIITSDMYLSKEFLEKVLAENGFAGYERFYLSSEEQKSKKTGRLYQKIVTDFAEEGITSNEILHIGDNKEIDINKAKQYGIETIFFPKAIDVFKRNKNFAPLYESIEETLDNSFLVGYIAQNIFDDPFIKYDKKTLFNGQWENLGTTIFGPLLTIFTAWMLEDAILENVDIIYFLHRDGYIPKILFDYMSKYYSDAPRSAQMYLNRSIMYSFIARSTSSLFHGLNKYSVSPNMTVEDFVRYRLLVSDKREKEEILAIFYNRGYKKSTQKIGNLLNNTELLNLLDPFFIKNCQQRTNAVKDYCNTLIDPNQNAAVFDVGYRGRAGKFLKDELGFACLEYHICARPELHRVNLNRYRIKSLIHAGADVVKETSIIYIILDDVLSIQEPGVAYIEKQDDFVPVMEKEYVYSHEIEILQDSIISFGKDFMDSFQDDLKLLYFDPFPVYDLLKKFLIIPSQKDAKMIKQLRCPDEPSFMDTGTRRKYLDWYQMRFQDIQDEKAKQITQRETFETVVKYKKLRIILDKLHLLPFAKAVYHKVFKNSKKELLKKCLKKIHLFNVTKKVYTYIKNLHAEEGTNSNSEPDYILTIESEIADCITKIAANQLLAGNNIMVIGYMVGFDKGVCNYLNQLSEKITNSNLVLFSEATRHTIEKTGSKIYFPFFIVPKLFDKNQSPPSKDIKITSKIQKAIQKNDYLSWAVSNLKKRNPNMVKGYQEVQAYYTQRYYSQVFDLLKPKCIIMWNAFEGLHHIVNCVAKEKNIPVLYMEFGSLPGTYALETSGQMGESYPSIHFEEFKTLEVSPEELKDAEKVWGFLKESRLNRNVQPAGFSLDDIRKKLKPGRPIILYAGQNDFESGLYPYTEHTKKYHSPVFRSSDEAAEFLADLAEKNDWNLIYKPHPLIMKLSRDKKTPHGTILVDNCDINDLIDLSDLTITILSQTGYVSLIRGKATLMLGYTQLKGKGCTYEAFAKEEVEGAISTALTNGLTPQMQYGFKKHIAQMLKYYLYDDLLEHGIQYGRDTDEAAHMINEMALM